MSYKIATGVIPFLTLVILLFLNLFYSVTKKKKVCKNMSKGDFISTHLTPSHTASSGRYGSRPHHVRNAVRVREEAGRS